MLPLAVIACHYNPVGYRRPVDNLKRFMAELSPKVKLYTAQILWSGQTAPIQSDLTFRGDADHILCQKERLLNLLERAVPAEYQYIAWVDADVLFHNPDWPEQTLEALQTHDVVQPWSILRPLGPFGDPESEWDGAGRVVDGHTGMAWAARRSVFPLFDRCMIGSSDAFMAHCWGRCDKFCSIEVVKAHELMRAHLDAWRRRQGQVRVGYVDGVISHLWHGYAANRNYASHIRGLLDLGFDPDRDVYLDRQGLWKWRRSDCAIYLWQHLLERREDA